MVFFVKYTISKFLVVNFFRSYFASSNSWSSAQYLHHPVGRTWATSYPSLSLSLPPLALPTFPLPPPLLQRELALLGTVQHTQPTHSLHSSFSIPLVLLPVPLHLSPVQPLLPVDQLQKFQSQNIIMLGYSISPNTFTPQHFTTLHTHSIPSTPTPHQFHTLTPLHNHVTRSTSTIPHTYPHFI